MKKSIFIITLLMFSVLLFGQRNEFGLQIGTSNITGDIGRTNYLYLFPDNLSKSEIPFHAGLFYQLNFNPQQSVRITGAYNHVSFNDAYAVEDYRIQRKLSGKNEMYELSATFNYYFFAVNEEQKNLLSPYIFGGFTAFNYSTPTLNIRHDFQRLPDGTPVALTPADPGNFTTTVTTGDNVNQFGFGIPFGIGLKWKFNYNYSLFAEMKFRPTFHDDLDYSLLNSKNIKVGYNMDIPSANDSTLSQIQDSPYIEIANQRNKQYTEVGFGNPNSKDWLNTFSLGFSYSFGRPPCYCK